MATLEERAAAIRAARQQPTDVPEMPSLEERAAAIRARRSSEVPEFTPEPVDPDSVGSIVGRTVDNLQASLAGTVAAVGEATGSEYLKDWGTEEVKAQQEEASQYGAPTYSSYNDVDWTQGDQVATFLKELGVSGTTSFGAITPGAVAGAKFSPGALKPVGAMIGGFLGGFGINAGGLHNEIKRIDPNGEHPLAVFGGGAALGLLDAVGVASVAKPFLKRFGSEVVYEQLRAVGVPKEIALGAVKGSTAEASTEGLGSVGRDITVANATDSEIVYDKLVENAINNMIGGAVVGGPAGGLVSGGVAVSNNNMVAGTAAATQGVDENIFGRKGSTEEKGVRGAIGGAFGTAATELLTPLSRISPTAKAFINRFRADKTGGVATEPTIFEANDLLVGKYRSQLDPVGRMSSRQLNKAFDDYLNNGRSQGAAILRDTLQSFLGEARASGMKVGQITDYLPTTLDNKRIKKLRDQVIQDFTPYFRDQASATKAVDEWLAKKELDPSEAVPEVDKMLEQDPTTGQWVVKKQFQKKGDPDSARYKFSQGYIPPKYGHLEQERAFANVPQRILEKYTKERTGKQKLQAIYDYLEGGAHRINFVKNFGETGEKLNADILKATNEAQQQGRQVTKGEVDRFYGIADAYNGMLNPVRNRTAKSALSTLSAVSTMADLPLATLSSLSEIALPAIRGDVSAAMKAMYPTAKQIVRNVMFESFKFVPKSEFSKTAAEANLTLSASLNIAAERLGANMMSRGAAKATRVFFLANGLSFWTHMTRIYAAKTADVIFHRNLSELAGGLPLDSGRGRLYVNQLQSMGVPIKSKADVDALYNPQTQSQRELAHGYRVLAMRRFTSQTILEPNVANTPLWMHDGHMQILANLKRYPAAFTNEILPQLVRRSSRQYAGSGINAMSGLIGTSFIVMGILMIGLLQDELKKRAKAIGTEVEDTRSDEQRFVDVMNSTLSPLHLNTISDLFAAPRYGASPVEVALGPVIGMGAKGITGIGSFMENPNEGIIYKTLYGMTPVVAPFKVGKEAVQEIDLFDDI